MADPQNVIGEAEIRERAVSLFTFLREFTKLRGKTVKDISQYETVLWFRDIPREQGCHCIVWEEERDASGDVWVEVHKPPLKPPPAPSESLSAWLERGQIADSSLDFPELRDRIVVEEAETPKGELHYRYLEDCREVKEEWEKYVQERWWPWAEEDRKVQGVQEVYTKLFSMYQRQQRLGEQYEVVLEIGYLTWESPHGGRVARHVIAAHTSLSFDAARGVISLGPAGEGAKPSLELDMLQPQDCPDAAHLRALERQLNEMGDDIWDLAQIHSVLSAWVHAASPKGEFIADLEPQQDVGPDPVLRFAPAIVLRRRTERTLLRVYEDILEQLRGGGPVPPGVRRLVTVVDDAAMAEELVPAEPGELRGRAEEPLFPLPANVEQRKIARELAARQGVLVQGPPGTGKSHTIANLMCHLLAEGKRVLVTSHAPRALKVLRKMIPAEISALCVSLLGNDREALQCLEDSVRGITDQYNVWEREANQTEIQRLERDLDTAKRGEAKLLAELRAIREKETHRHPPRWGGYQGTAAAIARRIREEEPELGWLRDRSEQGMEPPLSDDEACELLSLLRGQGTEFLGARHAGAPITSVLPPPEQFERLAKEESDARKRCETLATGVDLGLFSALQGVESNARGALGEVLRDVLSCLSRLRGLPESWVKAAVDDIAAGRDERWRDLARVTGEILGEVDPLLEKADDIGVTGLSDRDRKAVEDDAMVLIEHLSAGRKIRTRVLRSAVLKGREYLVRDILVDGKPCDKLERLQALVIYSRVVRRLDLIEKNWSGLADVSAATLTARAAQYKDLWTQLLAVLDLGHKLNRTRDLMARIPNLTAAPLNKMDEIGGFLGALDAVAAGDELLKARDPIARVESELRKPRAEGGCDAVLAELLGAVEARSAERYFEAYRALEKRKRAAQLSGLLASVAPETARCLAADPSDARWDKRMAAFQSAWNWALADRWYHAFSDPGTEKVLARELERIREKEIPKLTVDLAAARAWRHCFCRLTERERQHLVAWSKAIHRLGKGTGKYAAKHRAVAGENLEQCRSAIPAWIMPVYRVAETVQPGTEVFDVLIVDEASQSGADALFLFYLAKKVLVVGDDQQITPQDPGVDRQEVDILRERHIPSLPHKHDLGLDTSLFSLAEIHYPGRIPLREHFRCMPEIIGFSNDLCYRSQPLIPLRQYGTERLSPVIVCRHVPDGYAEGEHDVVNRPEAEALVNQIMECCNDPKYAGKSMGVVSLQGWPQARVIEMCLLQQLGPEEMESRHLVCGDAYAFQGDERDVIFLSMVAAPNKRTGALADAHAKQRFNVAVSRARDQLWLFHTASVNDLSKHCMRYALLEYCQNPTVPTRSCGPDPAELRRLTATADKQRESPPAPFDSWFEVDVFLRIAERGYRVIPQFPVAKYRIDLAVQGGGHCAAVECYGDEWHGADAFEADLARQRVLERCGWPFWSVYESDFRHNPDGAMEPLWTTLDRLKIRPMGEEVAEEPTEAPPPHQPDASSVGQAGALRHRVEPGSSAPGSASSLRPAPSLPGAGADQKSPPSAPSAAHQGRGRSRDLFGMSLTSSRKSVRPTPASDSSQRLLPISEYSTWASIKAYASWNPRPLPDPRTGPPEMVIAGLLDIVGVEGPMTSSRAFRLYAKAAGIDRVGRQIRASLQSAVRSAKRRRLVEEANEIGESVLRKPGTAPVIVRGLGNRDFSEIPPSEVATMVKLIRLQEPTLGARGLCRKTLDQYGIKRLASRVASRLQKIMRTYCPE